MHDHAHWTIRRSPEIAGVGGCLLNWGQKDCCIEPSDPQDGESPPWLIDHYLDGNFQFLEKAYYVLNKEMTNITVTILE